MNTFKTQKKFYLALTIIAWIISMFFIFVFLKVYIYNPYKIKKDCKNLIQKQLVSPASAKFSNYEEGKYWLIYYDVDSQNKFWAMIRSKRECTTNINKDKVESAKSRE